MCVECAPNPDYQHCPERETLRIRMKADSEVYREAIVVFEKDSLNVAVQARAERARLAYEVARRRFTDHVAAHHCE